MATVVWIGAQGDTPGKKVWTVTAGAGTTFTAAQNNKKAIFGPTAAETATEIAAGIVQAVRSSTFGELQELSSISNVAGVITAFGPADGATWTFDITASGGAGSISAATVTAPTSSHDLADVLNYSGGALPVAADTLVFENSSVGAYYNPTALAGIALAKVWRKGSYTGQIGLPRQSTRGYQEFRTRYVQFDSVNVQIDCTRNDTGVNGEARFFLQSIVTASTWVISGPVAGTLGSELVDCYGHVATSVLEITGAGVSVARFSGQTANLTTVLASNAAVSLGPGLATLTNVQMIGCNGSIQSNYNNLTIDGGGAVAVKDAAGKTGASPFTKVQSGTLTWQSTGNPGALTVESNAVFDASQAPGAFVIDSVGLIGDNWTFSDPNKRVTRGTLVFTLTGGSMDSGVITTGTGGSFTLTA